MIVRFKRKCFSSDKKDYSKNIIAGGGLVIGAKGLKSLQHPLIESMNKQSIKQVPAINEALIKEAGDLGVKVERIDGFGNSAYTGKGKIKRKLGKLGKKLLEQKGISDPNLHKIMDSVGNNKILIDGNDVDVLAHELGHAKFSNKKGHLLGRIAHNLMPAGKLTSKFSPVAGFVSGVNSGKKKVRGEEEGTVSKHIAWALPTIAETPVLAGEASATHQGIKDLKRLGADKELLGASKKRLGKAFGTYALGAGGAVLTSLAAREIGKAVGKIQESNKIKNKKRK